MFDAFKNAAGLAGILKDLPRIQAKVREVKDHADRIEVRAETGGGAVKAVANGKLRIVRIEVDAAILATLADEASVDHHAFATDLIAGAVNEALELAQQRMTEAVHEAAKELDLPIPPGALEGLL